MIPGKTISLIFLLSFGSTVTNAAESLSYSGRLVQANGSPVVGKVNIRAELDYTNSLSDPALCTQDIAEVVLTNGVFHVKLNFNCTLAGKTLTQVLSETPAGESVAIRITDLTHSKQYSYQALHALPKAIVAEQLPQMTATPGQALMWTGTKWWPSSVGTGNGTVTTINAGTGLTGGPITTTGTISIDNSGVGTAQIANSAVTAAKINGGEISNAHISATAAIDYSKLNIGVGEIPQDRINGLVSSMSSLIEDVINDAVTGKSPSQNAVYDALALKADRTNIAQSITALSVTGLTGPLAGADATNKTYVDNAVATVDTRVTTEVATLNTSIGNKYDKSGGVITGDVTLNTQLNLKGGANAVTVKANAGTGNYVLTLPASAGTLGYVLATDGSGNTSWVTPAVGSSSITDGSIVDADIHASAAIDQSKILNLTTDLAGKQPLISAGTTAQYYRGDKTFVDLATDVRGTTLTGYAVGTNTALSATDTTLGAFQNIQGQINATNTTVAGKEPTIAAGTTTQYYRGDKSWQELDGAVIANVPAGSIVATNVQSALNELDTEKQVKLISTSIIDSRELRFYELTANGSFYTSLKSPDDLAGNINYVLPVVAPTVGQVLSSSAAGVMSWISIPSAPVASTFGRTGAVIATAGDYTASQITNVPAGSIAATDVQAALNELASEKEPVLTNPSDTTKYYRGDKTWSTFATDAINSVLSTYALNAGAKPAVANTDSVVGAFGKVQKFINDINSDYVSKSADNTVTGSFNISGITSFIQVPTSTGAVVNEAANVQYVQNYVGGFGQWTKSASDIYRSSGNVAIGTATASSRLTVMATDNLTNNYPIQILNAADSMRTGHGAYGFSNKVGTAQNINYTYDVGGDQIFNTAATERMRITSAGNVAIGTTAQVWDEMLTIFKSSHNQVGVGVYSNNNAYTNSLMRVQTETAATTAWKMYEGRAAGGAIKYYIDGTGGGYFAGNVGVGTTTPSEKLEVSGNVKAAAYLYTSDKRLKKNIHQLDDALERVLNLRGVSFNWKENDQGEIGFIAQEVEENEPLLVVTSESNNMKSVKYGNIVALLVEAFREEHKNIEENKKLFTNMQSGLNKVEKKVGELAREVSSLKEDNKKLQDENRDLKKEIDLIKKHLKIK